VGRTAVNAGAGNHEGAWSWTSERAGGSANTRCVVPFQELNVRLDEYLVWEGWRPEEVRRSWMIGLIFGRDPAEARRKRAGRPEEALRARGIRIGTPAALQEQAERLGEAGVYRVMLQ
jgi:hypothetical protein